MATVDRHMGHPGGWDTRSGPAAERHHGRDTLAEVISIRPGRSHRPGLVGSLVTMARGLAAPRVQATSVRSTPHRPPSPASLPRPSGDGAVAGVGTARTARLAPSPAPHDAA